MNREDEQSHHNVNSELQEKNTEGKSTPFPLILGPLCTEEKTTPVMTRAREKCIELLGN
jgi:hypothetical protein